MSQPQGTFASRNINVLNVFATDNDLQIQVEGGTPRDLLLSSTSRINLTATSDSTIDIPVTTFSSNTSSTSSTTGAIVSNGGIGIGENINIGGNSNVAGNSTVTGTQTVTGSGSFGGHLTVFDTLNATSSSEAAIVSYGGIAAAEDITLGGALRFDVPSGSDVTFISSSGVLLTTNTPNLAVRPEGQTSTASQLLVGNVDATDTLISSTVGFQTGNQTFIPARIVVTGTDGNTTDTADMMITAGNISIEPANNFLEVTKTIAHTGPDGMTTSNDAGIVFFPNAVTDTANYTGVGADSGGGLAFKSFSGGDAYDYSLLGGFDGPGLSVEGYKLFGTNVSGTDMIVGTTLTVSDSTTSTSSTTGALVSRGGLGVVGDANIDGSVTVNNSMTLTQADSTIDFSGISGTAGITFGSAGNSFGFNSSLGTGITSTAYMLHYIDSNNDGPAGSFFRWAKGTDALDNISGGTELMKLLDDGILRLSSNFDTSLEFGTSLNAVKFDTGTGLGLTSSAYMQYFINSNSPPASRYFRWATGSDDTGNLSAGTQLMRLDDTGDLTLNGTFKYEGIDNGLTYNVSNIADYNPSGTIGITSGSTNTRGRVTFVTAAIPTSQDTAYIELVRSNGNYSSDSMGFVSWNTIDPQDNLDGFIGLSILPGTPTADVCRIYFKFSTNTARFAGNSSYSLNYMVIE